MATKKTFSEDEMKMPEEQFGGESPASTPSYIGIVIGFLIVALITILGGLYLWSDILKKNNMQADMPVVTRPTAEENNEPESNNAEADVQILETMSTSNEIDAIEADLESTNVEVLGNDLEAVKSELAQ